MEYVQLLEIFHYFYSVRKYLLLNSSKLSINHWFYSEPVAGMASGTLGEKDILPITRIYKASPQISCTKLLSVDGFLSCTAQTTGSSLHTSYPYYCTRIRHTNSPWLYNDKEGKRRLPRMALTAVCWTQSDIFQ